MSGCGYMYCKEIPSRQAAPCTQQQEQSDALHSRVSHHLTHTQPSQEPQVSYLPQRKATLSINPTTERLCQTTTNFLFSPSRLALKPHVNANQLGGEEFDGHNPQAVDSHSLLAHYRALLGAVPNGGWRLKRKER